MNAQSSEPETIIYDYMEKGWTREEARRTKSDYPL